MSFPPTIPVAKAVVAHITLRNICSCCAGLQSQLLEKLSEEPTKCDVFVFCVRCVACKHRCNASGGARRLRE